MHDVDKRPEDGQLADVEWLTEIRELVIQLPTDLAIKARREAGEETWIQMIFLGIDTNGRKEGRTLDENMRVSGVDISGWDLVPVRKPSAVRCYSSSLNDVLSRTVRDLHQMRVRIHERQSGP